MRADNTREPAGRFKFRPVAVGRRACRPLLALNARVQLVELEIVAQKSRARARAQVALTVAPASRARGQIQVGTSCSSASTYCCPRAAARLPAANSGGRLQAPLTVGRLKGRQARARASERDLRNAHTAQVCEPAGRHTNISHFHTVDRRNFDEPTRAEARRTN